MQSCLLLMRTHGGHIEGNQAFFLAIFYVVTTETTNIFGPLKDRNIYIYIFSFHCISTVIEPPLTSPAPFNFHPAGWEGMCIRQAAATTTHF